ncbi:MAG: hypothetical protein QM692_20540 [Thermomicrobiales bacterium]
MVRAKGCSVLDFPGSSLLDALRQGLSRREALAGALGLAALSLTAEADAKKNTKNKNKKRRQKRKKKKDRNCQAAGNTICNGACVDTNSDVSNCGSCFTFCASGQICAAGVCTVPCGDAACITNQISAGRPVTSVNVLANGNLAMLSPTKYQILILTTSGDKVGTVGKFGTAAGEMQQPLDLAVAADGTYLIADLGAGSGAFGYVTVIPPTGSASQIVQNWTTYSRNVAAGDDRFFSADWYWMNQIVPGTLVRNDYWNAVGTHSGDYNFDMITGIAAGGGKIYVVNGNVPDPGASGDTMGKVYAFSQVNSIPVPVDWSVGGVGSDDGQFNNAGGIALAGGRLYIADTDNWRVQALDAADGSYLFQWTTTDRLGNLIKPESIAVAANGVIWVTAGESLYGYTLVS